MAYDSIASHYSHSDRADPVPILVLTWKFLSNHGIPDLVQAWYAPSLTPPKTATLTHVLAIGDAELSVNAHIQKLILKALLPFIQKFAPSKISCYTVLWLVLVWTSCCTGLWSPKVLYESPLLLNARVFLQLIYFAYLNLQLLATVQ